MTRLTLDRRTFLRGALAGGAVAVGLPTLEAMLGPHGDALASGAPLPPRFGVWFWGNGVRLEHFVPAATGTRWTPTAELAGLADVQPWVSLVTGSAVKTASHPHHSGMAAVLTGDKYLQIGTTRDTIVSTMPRRTVDQDAADAIGALTPLRSLELGVTRFHGTDEGSTFAHVSHNGPNNPNSALYDPVAAWQRLFGAAADPARTHARASVLDAVADQSRRLQARLGVADRQRLDQHLESVRGLERRLAAGVAACDPGTPPVPAPDLDGREDIVGKNRVVAELVALALACDLTRVFTVQFSAAGAGTVFWTEGATDGMHGLTHLEPTPQPQVHANVTFTLARLGDFLRVLRDTPDGAGHLLDGVSILGCTELAEGWNHSNVDVPVFVLGKGGGRLRGGVHHRAVGENLSRAVLTALHGAGVMLPAWGVGPGEATVPHTELLA